MSSHSVVSDVLNALHISYNTKESPRRQDSSRGSFLRRKTSTTSIAESVKSRAGSIASVASIKSIARSLFKHKQQDDMEPITSKKTKGRGRGKKRGSVASNNSPQAIEAAKEAAILAETNKFYQSQSPLTVVLREPEALKKLLDGILDTPGGKRTVSRLARTCKVVSEPSLNILWRELYSFIPLIGMFPSPLLRRPKKAGLGLAKMPEDGDWEKVLEYGDKVQRITYDESAGNVSSTIFPIFEEYRPRTYLLPGLAHLTWRAETPVGLERCTQFLSPKLQTLNLEVGTRFPQLNTFLSDMSNKTRLTTFSFISPTTLPDSFTDILHSQTSLEKLTLVAPGALSPGVGRWMAALPHLKSLQLDLTGRSLIAVEGFFDELHPRSGDSTPSDVGTIDSGVFSADELDFSEIRKSALRLTGDLRSKSAFSKLRQLSLTGEAATIAVFLKHLSSHIRHLELAIEDPPDNADWQDLCTVLCERFGPALESLKITATGSSKFADLVRSTARLNGSGNRLSLEFFTFLPALRRLDIDLPESTTFLAADVSRLAAACPSLEELRLCPTATFPPQGGPPKLALEDLAPLLRACNKLYSVSVVINAQGSSSEVLHSRDVSSKSLQRLHVGHSWIKDPLHVAILLSHLAPNADTLRWFHERNRPGYIEVNDLGWQKVADALPLIQDVRNTERQRSVVVVHQRAEPVKPETAEMGVQATVSTASQGVSVRPIAREISIQAVPSYEDMEVDATVEVVSEGVSAQPDMADASVEVSVSTAEVSIDACTETAEASIEAIPPTVSKQVDATVFTLSKAVEALFIRGSEDASAPISPPQPRYAIPSPYDIFLAATSALIYYPLLIPMKIIDMSMSAMHRTQQRGTQNEEFSEKSMASIESPLPHEHLDTPMEIMTVPDLEVRQ